MKARFFHLHLRRGLQLVVVAAFHEPRLSGCITGITIFNCGVSIHHRCRFHPHKLRIQWSGFTAIQPLPQGGNLITITDIQSVNASVSELDAAGNPVPVDPTTAPSWSVSDSSILDVTSNADGSATIKAKGPLGKSQVSATLGGLSAVDEITVVNSAAAKLGINFGTPA